MHENHSVNDKFGNIANLQCLVFSPKCKIMLGYIAMSYILQETWMIQSEEAEVLGNYRSKLFRIYTLSPSNLHNFCRSFQSLLSGI